MADDAKPKPKPKPEGPNLTVTFAEIAGVVVVLILIGRVFVNIEERIGRWFGPDGFYGATTFEEFFGNLFYYASPYLVPAVIISNIASVFFLMGLIYSYIRLREVNQTVNSKYLSSAESETGASLATREQTKWDRIMAHISSDNPSDWKLAILEADIILDEILDKIGIAGNSIGDKLKKVEKSDFNTIDQAWEAHKIRNQIAHEGADYPLTEREARRVIGLYEEVFREFRYVT